MRVIIILVLILALVVGCASTTKSTLLGAGIGGAAGWGVGYAASDRHVEGTLVSAAIGAGVGGLIGYLCRKPQAPEPEVIQGPPKELGKPPALTKPKVRGMWVPDKIEGNKFIEGHYIYLIENPSAFIMEE